MGDPPPSRVRDYGAVVGTEEKRHKAKGGEVTVRLRSPQASAE